MYHLLVLVLTHSRPLTHDRYDLIFRFYFIFADLTIICLTVISLSFSPILHSIVFEVFYCILVYGNSIFIM